MVNVKEITVHFFLPEVREEIDLEFRYFEQTPQEFYEEYQEIRKKRLNADLDLSLIHI